MGDTLPADIKSQALSQETLPFADGAQVVLRRYGNALGPRVIVGHGNGFAADAFHPLWGTLLRDHEVIPLDLRNHGRNPRNALENHTHQAFVDDMAQVLRHLDEHYGKKATHGVLHSVSGLTALRLSLREPRRFTSLVVLDPPFLLPEGHPHLPSQIKAIDEIADGTRKRRETFESVDAFVARMQGREPFAAFQPGALRNLGQAILRPTPDGSVTLACPPEYEAKIYEDNVDDGLYENLRNIGHRVLLVHGAGDSVRHQLAAEAATLGGFDRLVLAGVTHLMPLERPRTIAEIARAYWSPNVD